MKCLYYVNALNKNSKTKSYMLFQRQLVKYWLKYYKRSIDKSTLVDTEDTD